MDLSEDNSPVRRRGRQVYCEEEEETEQTTNSAKYVLLPPSKLGMNARYELLWTEVEGGRKGPTHVIPVDISSHIIVAETIAIGLKEFAEKMGSRAKTFGLDRPIDKWELRFAGRDRLPRFDYPCRI